MKHKTLLLTAILTMSIVTIFTACPEPEPQEAEKKPIKPATCDGKPWEPTQWCVTTLASESLDAPYGIALAKDGTLYVTEHNGNKIKKLTLKEDGTLNAISIIAGSGTAGNTDGTGTVAQFNKPTGIAIAKDALYVANIGENIRKIALPGGEVTSIHIKLAPESIAVAPDGNTLYGAAGTLNIKKITLSDNNVEIIKTKLPIDGIAVTKDGLSLYVTDAFNHSIRKIALPGGKVSTIATNGFGVPTLAPDGTLYVTDSDNERIKQFTLKEDGSFEDPIIIAGSGTAGNADGIGTTAQFNRPIGIVAAQDKDGNTLLYVVDAKNNSIRKLEYKEAEAKD